MERRCHTVHLGQDRRRDPRQGRPEDASRFRRATLVTEWAVRKDGAITLYRSLTRLFKAAYPHIKLAADLEKELAVDALIASANFRATHLAIARLRNYAEFTPDQVGALTQAGVNNSQIANILTDPDVEAFYTDLLSRYMDQVDPADAAWLVSRLDPDNDALPY